MAITVPAGVVAFQAIVLRPEELSAPPDHIYLQSPERYEFIDKTDITKRYVIALSTGLYAPIAGAGGAPGVTRLVDASDYSSADLVNGNSAIKTAFGKTMLVVDNWDASTNNPNIVSSTPPPAGTSNTLVNTAGHIILATPINTITEVFNGDVIQYSVFTGVWTLFSKIPIMAVGDLTDGASLKASLTVFTTNAQTGTTYTLALTDAGQNVDMNNAAANTLTIPTNALVPFPIGTVIQVTQAGAGATTIAGAGGVTLAKAAARSYTISALLETATLTKVGTDTWRVAAN